DAELTRLELLDVAAWVPMHLKSWAAHPRAADLQVACTNTAEAQAQTLLLGQLLDNLLDNAFKYSGPGTAVKVSLERVEAVVTLVVEDGGPGTTEDDLPHVFEAFYRSAEARRQGKAGVGLGLAMAQRIATAFGGVLMVHSERGRGSRFSLRLPLTGSQG